MATQITINSVDFPNDPSGTQTTTFEYKLWNATSWTLASNTQVVNTDGTLVAPLVISGLTAGQLYYVRWSNNCDSPPEYYIQSFQL